MITKSALITTLRIGPTNQTLDSTPAMSGMSPTISTMTSGMSGAETKLRNFPAEKASAARTESFSSRATWDGGDACDGSAENRPDREEP